MERTQNLWAVVHAENFTSFIPIAGKRLEVDYQALARPSTGDASCKCSPPGYTRLIPDLSERAATRPWLTAEEVYGEAGKWTYPTQCGGAYRNAFKNMHAYFASLLREVSELPQTI